MFSISPAAYSALKYASLTFGLAGIIFIMGIFLGNLFGNITKRIVKRINLNGNLKKALGIDFDPETVAYKFVKYSIILIAIIAALIQIGIAISVMNFLLFVFAGIILISFSLALRDFVPNIVAGFYLISTRKLEKGDKIKFKDFNGVIRNVNLLNTQLEMNSRNTMLIPNSYLIKNLIIKVEKGRKLKAK